MRKLCKVHSSNLRAPQHLRKFSHFNFIKRNYSFLIFDVKNRNDIKICLFLFWKKGNYCFAKYSFRWHWVFKLNLLIKLERCWKLYDLIFAWLKFFYWHNIAYLMRQEFYNASNDTILSSYLQLNNLWYQWPNPRPMI